MEAGREVLDLMIIRLEEEMSEVVMASPGSRGPSTSENGTYTEPISEELTISVSVIALAWVEPL